MTPQPQLDEIRGAALQHMERLDQRHRHAILVAALLEGIFLVAFLLLADLHNRTHLLLLISTVAIYTIVGAGLFAVASFINRAVLRILKAVELLEPRLPGKG